MKIVFYQGVFKAF